MGTYDRFCVVCFTAKGITLNPFVMACPDKDLPQWKFLLRCALVAPEVEEAHQWALFINAARAEFGNMDGLLARRDEVEAFIRSELLALADRYGRHFRVPVVPETGSKSDLDGHAPSAKETDPASAKETDPPSAKETDQAAAPAKKSGASYTAAQIIGGIACGTAVGAAVGVLALPAVIGAVGFGTAGVVAGSVAAGWQATMGGTIAAGSLFASLQSMGALGAASAAAIGVSSATGAAIGGAAGTAVALKKAPQASPGAPSTAAAASVPAAAAASVPAAVPAAPPGAAEGHANGVRTLDEAVQALWDQILGAF